MSLDIKTTPEGRVDLSGLPLHPITRGLIEGLTWLVWGIVTGLLLLILRFG